MTKIEVESLSTATNAAVVRLPGRKFPGIVIQGDSLKNLFQFARDVAQLTRRSGISELVDSADELLNLVSGYLETYESALKAHNEPLPYPDSGSEKSK